MKHLTIAVALLAASAAPAMAQTSVSVEIGQPGFYGRIDLGGYSQQPQVVVSRPVIVLREPQRVVETVYLHVPPGHQKHWSKHCGEYHACGQNVYFVREDWYNNTYAPHYREQHGNGHGHDDGDRGRERDDEHGKGHGKGHDKHKD
ncbi:MAG: hypothetical protein V4508_25405 [Pseudomonadota bacterium]